MFFLYYFLSNFFTCLFLSFTHRDKLLFYNLSNIFFCVGDVLLSPTKIYVKPVLSLFKMTKVKAIAHITGGGLPGNVSRVLPVGTSVELNATRWQMPPVFRWIAKEVRLHHLFGRLVYIRSEIIHVLLLTDLSC